MIALPKLQLAPIRYSVTQLGGGTTGQGFSYPGGLDLETPSLRLHAGALRDGSNFECSQNGGYSRIEGYERFDGRTSPSAASFIIVQVDGFTTEPTVGDAISQAGTGATGVIALIVNDVEGGIFYMVVTQTTGVFNATGVINGINSTFIVDSTNSPFVVDSLNSPFVVPFPGTIGTAITQTVVVDSLLSAQYTAAAADIYRSDIGAVPGSGPLRGVRGMIFNGEANVYAFRDNTAATAVHLYKSSDAGWTLVPFHNLVSFTTGSVSEPIDGETLTQGGVTATIKRVMTQSGTYAGSTAAGDLVVGTATGGAFSAGAATTGSGSSLTLAGAVTPITLLPGGHFEFVVCNFSGQLETRRIYGCDGINKAFEFDGETLVPIATGLPTDAPSHIAFHKNHLFVTFDSSLLHSGPGTPFMWNSVAGGGEIATGDEVVGMASLPAAQTSATLVVFLRRNTAFLYGTGLVDFNFVNYSTGTGGLPYSAQTMFDTYVFDDHAGVVSLQTTLNFGNFQSSSLTRAIQPFIEQHRSRVIASSVNRSKSQYRVFFSDGYGLYLTIANKQYLGGVPVLFPNPVFCCDVGEDEDGQETAYFGSSDGGGYVYKMDVGTSFDGEDINAHITLAWDAFKSPRIYKHYSAASIEISSSSYAAISFGYQLGYSTQDIAQPTLVTYETNFSAAPMWDVFVWDNFVWDGVTLVPTDIELLGDAENIQVTIRCGTDYIDAFTLNSVIYHYTTRRGMRV